MSIHSTSISGQSRFVIGETYLFLNNLEKYSRNDLDKYTDCVIQLLNLKKNEIKEANLETLLQDHVARCAAGQLLPNDDKIASFVRFLFNQNGFDQNGKIRPCFSKNIIELEPKLEISPAPKTQIKSIPHHLIPPPTASTSTSRQSAIGLVSPDPKPHSISDIISFNEGWIKYKKSKANEDIATAIQMLTQVAQVSAAQLLLCRVYMLGEGVEKNYPLAVDYLQAFQNQSEVNLKYAFDFFKEKANKRQSSVATTLLASCYFYGLGVSQNKDLAFKLFQRAAKKEDKFAKLFLGYYYQLGDGIKKNLNKAIDYYFDAANAEADCNIGIIYLLGGVSIRKNLKKALEYLQKAADQNYPFAQLQLGKIFIADALQNLDSMKPYLFINGANGVSIQKNNSADHQKGVEYLQKAVDRENTEAIAFLGICYEEGIGVDPDPSKAFQLYRKSAQSNIPIGLFRLGKCFENGIGTEINLSEAFNKYQEAGNKKHPEALFKIGHFYAEGIGVKKNENYAVLHYSKASEQGFTMASYKLGELFENSSPIQEKLAKQSYKEAASVGVPEALYKMGRIYELGLLGTEKKSDKAYEYYISAQQKGNTKAFAALVRLGILKVDVKKRIAGKRRSAGSSNKKVSKKDHRPSAAKVRKKNKNSISFLLD